MTMVSRTKAKCSECGKVYTKGILRGIHLSKEGEIQMTDAQRNFINAKCPKCGSGDSREAGFLNFIYRHVNKD